MQAYQSPPCTYCGVTWNPPGSQTCGNCRNPLAAPPAYAPPGYPGYPPPGYPQPGQYPAPPAGYQPGAPYAQPQPQFQPQQFPGYAAPAPEIPEAAGSVQVFGQSIRLPFVIPAALVPYQRYLLIAPALAIALGVLLLLVTPAIAAGELDRGAKAIKTMTSHQAAVDAAFASFFSTASASNDPNAEKTALQKQAKLFDTALADIKSDEATLRSVDQSLSLLQPVTPLKGGAIAAERRQLGIALSGLGQADRALTVAVNEVNVALPYIDAVIGYAKMGAALGRHDLVAAGAPYPDAQQKLEVAMSIDHAEGLPPAIAKQVSSFNDALNGTEALVQALQAKDAAAIKKANDAIALAVKAMASPAESVPADYESKTFGPMQKAYDSALKTLKG